MTNRWEKLGRIFVPEGSPWWMQTHVQVPFADHRGGSLYRVYFGTRDSEVRSRVGWFEIDLEEPTRILRVSEQPSLDLGERGCFDDNGVTPSWIVNRGSEKYLYYFGWNRGTTVAFHVFSGLAISRDGGDSFERIQRTPILDRRPNDPFLATAPCVLKSDREWRVWYASGEDYDIFDKGTYYPRYRIKTGSSKDGIEWERSGEICIDFESSDEYAITRPCVRADKGEYEMWYSTKGGAYRMGYARSSDGVHWRRQDEVVGIDRSVDGWDSAMIEYAHIFSHGDLDYMLYNGNEYGGSGIGLAIRTREIAK